MIPAAVFTRPDTSGSSPECSGVDDGVCCPNCGQEIRQEQLLAAIRELVGEKQSRLDQLRSEEIETKQRWLEFVEKKQRLARQWNEVLLARSRVAVAKKVCAAQREQSKRELEELQLLEKANRRRAERLKHVVSKDFHHKGTEVTLRIAKEREVLETRLSELEGVRRRFVTELYHKVFPMEVLPLSDADAGAEDYSERVRIDCDHMLELDGGWVLGGVHCHPTPHISIVAPALPVNGDHALYLHALAKRTRNKGEMQETSLHPFNDPFLSVPAALGYVAHFVEVIAWALDQPLPFPLPRPVAVSEYGNPMKKRRAFLSSMAKLDDNIVYLCFSQHVPLSALAAGRTLQNLLALVTHSQLGRTGPFECYPELASYWVPDALPPSQALHDSEDSLPPIVSYTATQSNTESEGDEEEEEQGGGGAFGYTAEADVMDWEHLEPSTEETRLFEEERMKQALLAAAASNDREELAHKQVQEVEIYRQKLRRLDYNSTYKDYATMMAATAGSSSSADGVHTTSMGSSGHKEAEGLSPQQQQQEGGATSPLQPLASGILGTLSSLWTSTFGGSRS